jgi:hypothetical protein
MLYCCELSGFVLPNLSRKLISVFALAHGNSTYRQILQRMVCAGISLYTRQVFMPEICGKVSLVKQYNDIRQRRTKPDVRLLAVLLRAIFTTAAKAEGRSAMEALYYIYLRKSRGDGEETVADVLARHERILQEYAVRHTGSMIPEEHIFREVVSGETIRDRPMMLKLLSLIQEQL